MNELRSIYRVDLSSSKLEELSPREASQIKVKEKRIENWLVNQWGYNLPVRAALCRMYSKAVAEGIAGSLREIAGGTE